MGAKSGARCTSSIRRIFEISSPASELGCGGFGRDGGRALSRLRFEWRYWTRNAPWDSGVTPPEVLAFLERTPPGRALDLGCGTGTNAIAMAQRGWDVTAVDFSSTALGRARRKTARARVSVRFLQRDVTRLDDLTGPFDFALDLGCFHGLAPSSRAGYVATLARLLRPAAVLMLYTFLEPSQGWPAESEILQLYGEAFDLANIDRGEFRGRPSGWFTWIRQL